MFFNYCFAQNDCKGQNPVDASNILADAIPSAGNASNILADAIPSTGNASNILADAIPSAGNASNILADAIPSAVVTSYYFVNTTYSTTYHFIAFADINNLIKNRLIITPKPEIG